MGDTTTGLTVRGRHWPLAFVLYLTKLTVAIDGVAQVGPWSSRFIPVTPGQHRVDIYFRYIFQSRCSEATVTLDVPEGRTLNVEYRAPYFFFVLPGRIAVTG